MSTRKNTMSLRREIIIGMVGSMLIVTLFLSISYLLMLSRIIYRTTLKSVNQNMEILDKDISGILGEYNDLVVHLSNVIPELESREQIKSVISSLGKNLTKDTLLYYATTEQLWDGGALISHSGWEPSADFDMQSRLWHKNAVSNRNKICYTEPFIDANTGKTIVTISYRVLDDNGKVIGVSAFDIVLDALSEAVQNISISNHGHIYLITSEGLFLTNENLKAIMAENYFDASEFKKYSRTSYLDGTEKVFIEGKSYYGVRKIVGTDWYIAAEGPISDFAGEYMKQIVYVLIGLSCIFVLMVILDIVLSNRVSRSFRIIASGCEAIAKGDFSKKYNESFTKEATLLARGFNSFSERLQGIVKSMKKSKSALTKAGEYLKDGTADTQAAISQVLSSIEGMGENLRRQNVGVEQTSVSISSVLKNVKSLEKLVSSQTSAVQGASGAVEQMISNIGEVNESVDKMAQSFSVIASNADDGAKTQSELQEKIGDIETQSNLLSEANAVIANIAEQTNLLAMNAAIEAAHAGEAGKGFAVVADEIRKLSETSTSQSKTIGDQLSNIQSTIETVVEATQRGVSDYDRLANEIRATDLLVQQIRVAMREQQSGSSLITEALRGMNDSTTQVQKASQKMTSESQMIANEINTLQEKAADMKNGMDEMSASAKKIEETGAALSDISEIVEKSIVEIGKQIDQFETE